MAAAAAAADGIEKAKMMSNIKRVKLKGVAADDDIDAILFFYISISCFVSQCDDLQRSGVCFKYKELEKVELCFGWKSRPNNIIHQASYSLHHIKSHEYIDILERFFSVYEIQSVTLSILTQLVRNLKKNYFNQLYVLGRVLGTLKNFLS